MIAECQEREEEMTRKKQELEADKVKLLATVRAETQDLQDQKEELLSNLTSLKLRVDETKATVSIRI